MMELLAVSGFLAQFQGGVQLLFGLRAAPRWFPTTCLFAGLTLVVLGATRVALSTQLSELWHRATTRQQRVLFATLALGLTCCSIGALQRFDLLVPYVVLLYALGRAIEGVAAVVMYQKLVRLVRGDGNGAGLTRKVRHGLVSVFVVLTGGWLAIWILNNGPVIRSTVYDLLVIWTLLNATLTAIGLYWKFTAVETQYPRGVVLGTILCVTGAELYNFTTVWSELGALAVGTVGYSVGFWVAVFLWIRGRLS